MAVNAITLLSVTDIELMLMGLSFRQNLIKQSATSRCTGWPLSAAAESFFLREGESFHKSRGLHFIAIKCVGFLATIL